jgi:uncharacterized protein
MKNEVFCMFKINLASFDVRKELFFEADKSEISFDEGIELIDTMKVELTLTKDAQTAVIVEGRMDGNVRMTCGRCLEDFIAPVTVGFAVIYKDKENVTEDDRDSGVYEYENNEIDLYPYLRETMILELPVKPVCSDDCKGLCPVCGKNMNETECKCEKEKEPKATYKPFEGLDLK